jgi:hypothetical protein
LVISNVIHADDELTAELKEELDVSWSKSRICLFLSVAAGCDGIERQIIKCRMITKYLLFYNKKTVSIYWNGFVCLYLSSLAYRKFRGVYMLRIVLIPLEKYPLNLTNLYLAWVRHMPLRWWILQRANFLGFVLLTKLAGRLPIYGHC